MKQTKHTIWYDKYQFTNSTDLSVRFYHKFSDRPTMENTWQIKSHKRKTYSQLHQSIVEQLIADGLLSEPVEVIGRTYPGYKHHIKHHVTDNGANIELIDEYTDTVTKLREYHEPTICTATYAPDTIARMMATAEMEVQEYNYPTEADAAISAENERAESSELEDYINGKLRTTYDTDPDRDIAYYITIINKYALNKQLIITQQVTLDGIETIGAIHNDLNRLLSCDKETLLTDYGFIDNILRNITNYEYRLQAAWNFPQDKSYHKYDLQLDGCKCPIADNLERIPHGRIVNQSCPYHGDNNGD